MAFKGAMATDLAKKWESIPDLRRRAAKLDLVGILLCSQTLLSGAVHGKEHLPGDHLRQRPAPAVGYPGIGVARGDPNAGGSH